MNTLIVYPENLEQLVAIEAVMKALKISCEQKREVYPEHVLEGIKRGLQQTREGKLRPYIGIKDLLYEVKSGSIK